jgi:alpha,alpha-trehalose phosphorylase
LPAAHLLKYDRRLNMRSGTLDRELIWGDASRQTGVDHISAFSLLCRPTCSCYLLFWTILNARAFVVISSEMATPESGAVSDTDDPRLAKAVSGRILHQRANYSKDRRVVLCHGTENSLLKLACATESVLESTCPYSYKTVHTADSAKLLHDRRSARQSDPPHKVYGLSHVRHGFR